MADMTATGWDAADAITVLKSWRPYSGRRMALVQMTLTATNFGGGAGVYPGEGIPLPNPSTVGFRGNIDYVIPLGALTLATGTGRHLTWGCIPQTYTASGTTAGPYMRVEGLGGASPSAGPTFILEAVSTQAASDLFTTNAYRTNAIFVGG